MITPEQYAAAARAAERRLPRPAAELADLYARYETEKRRKRWLDFDDLLGWCADAIERDADFAAAQRWRFRHLFVDEFQDATPLQTRLLRAWLGDRPDLCVVGDGAQAIYAFAGADASPLTDFARHFPGGRTIALVYNYRSTDAIVAVAEAALGPASGVERDAPRAVRPADRAADDRRLRRRRARSRDDRRRVLARVHRRRAVAPHGGPVPHQRAVVAVRDRAGAARRAVSRHGRAAVRGPARRCACCSTGCARPSATRRRARSPITSPTSPPTPTPTPTRRSGARRRRRPGARRRPPPDADRTATSCATHRDALLALRPRLRRGRSRRAARSPASSSWLEFATRGESADERGVDLVTFHRAKGLEWQVVFVTGLERGLVPISWAATPAARAEERRLLHVALGRAEDWLHCSWARERTAHGRRSARQPSPWLGELEQAIERTPVAPVDPQGAHRRRARDARARRTARSPRVTPGASRADRRARGSVA